MSDDLHLDLRLERADFALRVDLHLPAQGITVLFGASGSGKTSLLRCVAGLEQAQGKVRVGQEVWQDSARNLFQPTWQRQLGYVFQEASLFEHLDVQGNLQFGLQRQRGGQDRRRLDEAVDLLGIAHLLGRSVGGLSGGERQRVAIARALAVQPRLLLLDEPLASLDPARRQEVLPWLERLHSELRIPLLYVTHALDELARLADHAVMLEHGQVRASGPLTDLMAAPAVAMALGEEAGVVLPGRVVARDAAHHMSHIACAAGELWGRDLQLPAGHALRLRILARDVSLSLKAHEDTSIQNRLHGVIAAIENDAHPSQALVRVMCADTPLLARVTRRAIAQLGLQVGHPVWCQVKSVALIV